LAGHAASESEKRYKHRMYVGSIKWSEELKGEGVKTVCTLNVCRWREVIGLISWKYERMEPLNGDLLFPCCGHMLRFWKD
jgi:hypothetical protein